MRIYEGPSWSVWNNRGNGWWGIGIRVNINDLSVMARIGPYTLWFHGIEDWYD